ncbi:MAG: chaplin [Hamadaea sp.]|uniref:chaplin family protein n=1 Tax=Hamadaea sp. TaxID=2024425 RepID=UPI0018099C57|nr:chaplin family protein [Hamadaea sp.]NUR71298.1 chaplin [Hamadaea sp.]NUT19476.1 chaplin [Hamadaea sp.]
MKTWVRRSLNAGALTAGALLATGTAASADATLVSSDNVGILNGTQVLLPIQAPIDVCGNAVAVGGVAGAGCVGGSAATLSPEWGWAHYQTAAKSGPNIGIGNGTQIIAPIQIPVDVCGNAVAVLGQAYAGCEGGASATITGKTKPGGHYYKKESTEAGVLPTEGLVDGLPVVGDLLGGLTGGSGLPVVGGLLGGQSPAAGLLGGQPTTLGGQHATEVLESTGGPTEGNNHGYPCGCPSGHDDHGHGGPGNHGGPTLISTDNIGILNGTQVYAPVQIPVNISGNAIGVLGSASAWSVGGSSARQ